MYKYNDDSIKILSDSESIKAYVHPLRQTILKYLSDKKMTVSEVAQRLGVHPANITHHFRILEKCKLIVLAEKRDSGRNIEKLYRPTAKNFFVNTEAMPLKNKRVMALSMLRDDLDRTIARAKSDTSVKVLAFLETIKVGPDDFEWLKVRIQQLKVELALRNEGLSENYIANISFYKREVDGADDAEPIIVE